MAHFPPEKDVLCHSKRKINVANRYGSLPHGHHENHFCDEYTLVNIITGNFGCPTSIQLSSKYPNCYTLDSWPDLRVNFIPGNQFLIICNIKAVDSIPHLKTTNDILAVFTSPCVLQSFKVAPP
jgi:hypothetical protein